MRQTSLALKTPSLGERQSFLLQQTEYLLSSCFRTLTQVWCVGGEGQHVGQSPEPGGLTPGEGVGVVLEAGNGFVECDAPLEVWAKFTIPQSRH